MCKMTKELFRQYNQEFQYDPDIFMDIQKMPTYVFSETASDASYERQIALGRLHMAIMLETEPIGEIILKNIDWENHHCTLGIHLKNDSLKNCGYGTQAEILLLQYAFDRLGMETVYADAILKNERSQHVLQMVGFTETGKDDTFRYYRCDKSTWCIPGSDNRNPNQQSMNRLC